jgi:alkylhydroperoxidase family enzyme
MANVRLADRPTGLIQRLTWAYGKRRFGRTVDPVRVVALHTGVLIAGGALETAVANGWKALDPHLRHLAIQATSGRIGCTWCIDYGYYEAMQEGVDPQKVRDVAHWRDSDVYDERERSVLEYAEAATATPAEIPLDLVERLHAHFSDKEIVELAAWVSLENYRSRFNAGLGLSSEGFSDACAVPLSTVGA